MEVSYFVGALLLLGLSGFTFFRTIKMFVESGAHNSSESISASVFGATTVAVGSDLLGKAEIGYAGGTDGRNKNIELGASRVDGTVILPGQEFSFTKAIGEVRKEDGFSEEKVFQNGEVTKGLGGGLCQVSTALFRSVLDAGLSVTERSNHTYSVSRYDVGLDATYSDPGPDFRFVNDTPSPISLRAKTMDQKVIFEIYGTKDGRQASTTEAEITDIVDFPPTKYVDVVEIPKDQSECINTPQIGYTARVTYDVLYSTGEEKQRVFTSRYKPLQRVCYVVKKV